MKQLIVDMLRWRDTCSSVILLTIAIILQLLICVTEASVPESCNPVGSQKLIRRLDTANVAAYVFTTPAPSRPSDDPWSSDSGVRIRSGRYANATFSFPEGCRLNFTMVSINTDCRVETTLRLRPFSDPSVLRRFNQQQGRCGSFPRNFTIASPDVFFPVHLEVSIQMSPSEQQRSCLFESPKAPGGIFTPTVKLYAQDIVNCSDWYGPSRFSPLLINESGLKYRCICDVYDCQEPRKCQHPSHGTVSTSAPHEESQESRSTSAPNTTATTTSTDINNKSLTALADHSSTIATKPLPQTTASERTLKTDTGSATTLSHATSFAARATSLPHVTSSPAGATSLPHVTSSAAGGTTLVCSQLQTSPGSIDQIWIGVASSFVTAVLVSIVAIVIAKRSAINSWIHAAVTWGRAIHQPAIGTPTATADHVGHCTNNDHEYADITHGARYNSYSCATAPTLTIAAEAGNDHGAERRNTGQGHTNTPRDLTISCAKPLDPLPSNVHSYEYVQPGRVESANPLYSFAQLRDQETKQDDTSNPYLDPKDQ